MLITVEENPIDYFPYLSVSQGGQRDDEGKRKAETEQLEIYKGTFHDPQIDWDALIVTSDLQGWVVENNQPVLLGESLPSFLRLFITLELQQVDPLKTGVVLCGDLYAMHEKRGGLGDVRGVWREFSKQFKWVCGVAGNHDDFGDKQDFEAFKREEGIYFLNREVRKVDKKAIGGISGIIGPADKPNRVEESEFLSILKKLLLQQPAILALHQGPDYPPEQLEGLSSIRETIEQSPPNLVFCGHCHWPKPLVVLKNGTQVLNADKRVVILQNSRLG